MTQRPPRGSKSPDLNQEPPPRGVATFLRLNSSIAGDWFIASDICKALELTPYYLKKLPEGTKSKGMDDDGNNVTTVNLEGVLLLITMTGIWGNLAPHETTPCEYLDENGRYSSNVTNYHQGVLRGLGFAVAAIRKINKASKDADKVRQEATGKTQAVTLKEPPKRPRRNDQNLSGGI